MKSHLLPSTMLIALSTLTVPLFAQDSASTMPAMQQTMPASSQGDVTPTKDRFKKQNFRTWSFGLQGGVLSSSTIFRGRANDFNTTDEDLGFGGYIRKQISPAFGLQADFLAGNVRGLRAQSLAGTANYDGSKFDAHIKWSAAVTGNFTIASFNVNRINTYFAPYIKAGAGYMQSNAKVTNLGANTDYNNSWFIPIGAGVKFGVSKGINIDLGYDVNFVKSGTFDGVNSGRYDNFSYSHLGLEFALGKKSNPELAKYSAIAALRKADAEESAELRSQLLKSEQDAASMKSQYSSDQAQLAKDLADDDHDGVANKFDKCPGTPADSTVDGAGCPFVVKPQIIKETKVIVTEEDRRVVNEAIKNLEFDLGKSTIKASSDSSLGRVAALLVQKNFSLKLSGHTDNVGSAAANLRLSKDRAEAVKAYLVEQGANPSRIEATGYGAGQPIASNKTAGGRQQNRRVEFTIY